jgi:steroid delta-isomerase-like uncharacterized protein
MDAIQVAHQYFAGWNRHDPPAILATFAEGGTYTDPASGGALAGPAIAGYAGALFDAFPDLNFEVVSVGPMGPDLVAAQWVMYGTNTGPILGLPPTGEKISLPGADFIQVEGERIRSVRGYFDQKEFVQQLGLQTVVQPKSLGPLVFGTAVGLEGPPVQPGALSLTLLEARSAEEVMRVSELSRAVIRDLHNVPGFLGGLFVTLGTRMLTLTSWTDAEAPRGLLENEAHRQAMSKFFGPEVAAGGRISTWTSARTHPAWVRCRECNRMSDHGRAEGRCSCGATLPDPAAVL